MKKRRKAAGAILVSCLALSLLTGCEKKLSLQEYLELGQKYLSEADYDKAVVAFSKAIQIDKKNVEANRQIAAAYEKINKPDQAAEAMLNVLVSDQGQYGDIEQFCRFLEQVENASDRVVFAQMAYAQTGDEDILPLLFAAKGEQGDFDGIKRIMEDVDRVSGMKDAYLEDVIQKYYDEEDFDSMKELSKVLEETDHCQGMDLVIDLLQEYKEMGKMGSQRFLNAFMKMKKNCLILTQTVSFTLETGMKMALEMAMASAFMVQA